jgi:lipoprotein NlpI
MAVLVRSIGVFLVGGALVGHSRVDAVDTIEDSSQTARRALAEGKLDVALDAANRAADLAAEDPGPLLLRARIFEARREPEKSLADCDALLQPERLAKLAEPADVYDLRGRIRFRLADVVGSAEDFDRAVELDPRRGAGHWQRGISYYYAERFQEGHKQFEGYQTVDDADVENAVWRFLCMAPESGLATAQREILKIGDDRRVPMREIYAMFAGQRTVDDVLAAAEAGDISEASRRDRRFYAHLYVGLYLESSGERAAGLEHIRLAAEKYPIQHYMADVARTHHKLREKPPTIDR